MVAARKRKVEFLHQMGLKAHGGRPSRIPYWLRKALIEAAAEELSGLHLEPILTAPIPDIAETSVTEALAQFQRLDTAILLDRLQAKDYRSEPVIRAAWHASHIRAARLQRGEKSRDHLDELIEDAARR